MISDDEFDDYESGPFCPHYNEPGDGCLEMCQCGHRCDQHYSDTNGGACFRGHFKDHDCPPCACVRFTDDVAFGHAPDRQWGDARNDARAVMWPWASWDFPNGKHITVSFQSPDSVAGAGWPDGPAWGPLNTAAQREAIWEWAREDAGQPSPSSGKVGP